MKEENTRDIKSLFYNEINIHLFDDETKKEIYKYF